MVLKLHGLPMSSCTGRVMACLHEKGVKFELVHVNLMEGAHKQPSFTSMNPFALIPVLEDGDLTLFESRAITSYIAEKYKESGTDLLGLSNPKDAAMVKVWLEVETQQFNPFASVLFAQAVLAPVYGQTPDQAVIDSNMEKLGKVLDVYEGRLAKTKYLAGDFYSLADLHHLTITHYLMKTQCASVINDRPHVKAWWEDISSRPAFQKIAPGAGDEVRTMPVIGMGTALSNSLNNQDVAKSAILEAIKVGYRHFDTAAMYKTEQPLGRAIQEALVLGLIKSREELFITTKLWCNSTERHLVLPAIRKSLQNLGLEYVDLYLIHWPLKLSMSIEEFKVPIPSDCISAIDIKSVWEAMEECQKLGLTRAIGVSNFSSKKLDEILSFAKIPPAVNQVEVNPLWQQKKLRDYCKEKGIILTAYCPLGAVGAAWGNNRVMQSDVIVDIAKSKGKTTAQVSLRWLYEQGVTFVPKSFNKDRMKENIQIFDWSLSEEDSNRIGQLAQHKGVYFSTMAETCDLVAEIDAEI